jgi:hypothetical protein
VIVVFVGVPGVVGVVGVVSSARTDWRSLPVYAESKG